MNSCNGWEQGLTGQIDFSTEYCYIEKPQYACFQSIFDGLLDFSSLDQCDIKDLNEYRNDLINKWFYTNFQNQVSEERMQMLEDGKVNVLGFPNTALYTQQDRYPTGMAKRLVNRTQFLENVEQGKQQNIEVMLDLQNMDMVYNLQRNETLVNERIKKQSKDSMSDNIIIIYIDDLSRVQAHRKLKETLKFFDKYAIKTGMSDKKKQKIYDLGKRVFEFYRFHVVGQQTQPILFRLAYGIKLQKQKHKPPENKKDMIFQHFKDMGYIVGFSSNTCTLWCLHRSKIMRNDVNESPPDHEYYSTVFDPTYTDPKDYFSIFQGPNSIYRRCLYGYDTNYHVLNYGYQFMQTYKNDKKVLYLEFTDSHELTDEVVKYLDTNLRNFLDDLENNNHISKKTTIYLVSDHGQHLKRIVYFTDLIRKRFEQERSLPALFILQTTDVFEQNKQLEFNLQKNEQALFSVEQLRNTWITNVQSMEKINNDIAKNNEQDQLFGKMDLYKQCSDLDLEDKPSDHLCQCFEDLEQMEILNNM
ncbi:Alkaline-phosphatase-like, core domain [Pseudocohnilembus persalinus]|uniref:Alkaline-phosphatase-like, core domain n=1 Tax=Pseudocohnilembus persalinus TaxID=266149 RepID=A0A0V0QSD4_PSEPJ|nr:Alkaline-phosphatase-like, core domain [Pseudocohnilembus persalinus]|eukprot:KRX04954.1 Alkaline-phosphatase-like, core domain [Pseudocohnilembus persalinus]